MTTQSSNPEASLYASPPDINALLGAHAPHWLIKSCEYHFKNNIVEYVTHVVGKAARLLGPASEKVALSWAQETLTEERIDNCVTNLAIKASKALDDLSEALAYYHEDPDIQHHYVFGVIANRDSIESDLQFMQRIAPNHPKMRFIREHLEHLDQELRNNKWLLAKPLTDPNEPDEADIAQFRFIRNRCPDAWWLHQAQLN